MHCVLHFILVCYRGKAVAMGKERSAGMLIFRRSGSRIEYLLLKASEADKTWSPPKGCVLLRGLGGLK